MHKTICVKVNAYVDEKISPIIETLSKIDGLVTEQCCENHFNDGIAQVTFTYKDKHSQWRNIGKICEMLTKTLLYDFENVEISVRWQPFWDSYAEGVFRFKTSDACNIANTLNRKLFDAV